MLHHHPLLLLLLLTLTLAATATATSSSSSGSSGGKGMPSFAAEHGGALRSAAKMLLSLPPRAQHAPPPPPPPPAASASSEFSCGYPGPCASLEDAMEHVLKGGPLVHKNQLLRLDLAEPFDIAMVAHAARHKVWDSEEEHLAHLYHGPTRVGSHRHPLPVPSAVEDNMELEFLQEGLRNPERSETNPDDPTAPSPGSLQPWLDSEAVHAAQVKVEHCQHIKTCLADRCNAKMRCAELDLQMAAPTLTLAESTAACAQGVRPAFLRLLRTRGQPTCTGVEAEGVDASVTQAICGELRVEALRCLQSEDAIRACSASCGTGQQCNAKVALAFQNRRDVQCSSEYFLGRGLVETVQYYIDNGEAYLTEHVQSSTQRIHDRIAEVTAQGNAVREAILGDLDAARDIVASAIPKWLQGFQMVPTAVSEGNLNHIRMTTSEDFRQSWLMPMGEIAVTKIDAEIKTDEDVANRLLDIKVEGEIENGAVKVSLNFRKAGAAELTLSGHLETTGSSVVRATITGTRTAATDNGANPDGTSWTISGQFDFASDDGLQVLASAFQRSKLPVPSIPSASVQFSLNLGTGQVNIEGTINGEWDVAGGVSAEGTFTIVSGFSAPVIQRDPVEVDEEIEDEERIVNQGVQSPVAPVEIPAAAKEASFDWSTAKCPCDSDSGKSPAEKEELGCNVPDRSSSPTSCEWRRLGNLDPCAFDDPRIDERLRAQYEDFRPHGLCLREDINEWISRSNIATIIEMDETTDLLVQEEGAEEAETESEAEAAETAAETDAAATADGPEASSRRRTYGITIDVTITKASISANERARGDAEPILTADLKIRKDPARSGWKAWSVKAGVKVRGFTRSETDGGLMLNLDFQPEGQAPSISDIAQDWGLNTNRFPEDMQSGLSTTRISGAGIMINFKSKEYSFHIATAFDQGTPLALTVPHTEVGLEARQFSFQFSHVLVPGEPAAEGETETEAAREYKSTLAIAASGEVSFGTRDAPEPDTPVAPTNGTAGETDQLLQEEPTGPSLGDAAAAMIDGADANSVADQIPNIVFDYAGIVYTYEWDPSRRRDQPARRASHTIALELAKTKASAPFVWKGLSIPRSRLAFEYKDNTYSGALHIEADISVRESETDTQKSWVDLFNVRRGLLQAELSVNSETRAINARLAGSLGMTVGERNVKLTALYRAESEVGGGSTPAPGSGSGSAGEPDASGSGSTTGSGSTPATGDATGSSDGAENEADNDLGPNTDAVDLLVATPEVTTDGPPAPEMETGSETAADERSTEFNLILQVELEPPVMLFNNPGMATFGISRMALELYNHGIYMETDSVFTISASQELHASLYAGSKPSDVEGNNVPNDLYIGVKFTDAGGAPHSPSVNLNIAELASQISMSSETQDVATGSFAFNMPTACELAYTSFPGKASAGRHWTFVAGGETHFRDTGLSENDDGRIVANDETELLVSEEPRTDRVTFTINDFTVMGREAGSNGLTLAGGFYVSTSGIYLFVDAPPRDAHGAWNVDMDMGEEIGTVQAGISKVALSASLDAIDLTGFTYIRLPEGVNDMLAGKPEEGEERKWFQKIWTTDADISASFTATIGFEWPSLTFQLLSSPFQGVEFTQCEGMPVCIDATGSEFGDWKLGVPAVVVGFEGVSLTGLTAQRDGEFKIPTNWIKGAFEAMGAGFLTEGLPDSFRIDGYTMIDEEGNFSLETFLNSIESGTGMPVSLDNWAELLAHASDAEGSFEERKAAILDRLQGAVSAFSTQVNRWMPSRMRRYLSFTVPSYLDLGMLYGVETSGTISTMDSSGTRMEPFQILSPTPTGIIGARLHKFSLGTLFWGTFYTFEVDAEVDIFGIGSVALSGGLAVAEAIARRSAEGEFEPWDNWAEFAQTRRMALRVADTRGLGLMAFPYVPIPVFFEQLRIDVRSVLDFELMGTVAFPVPRANDDSLRNILTMVKSALEDDDFSLAAQPAPVDIYFTNGPHYAKLPSYFGGGSAGDRLQADRYDLWPKIATVLDAIIKFRPVAVIQNYPFAERTASGGVKVLWDFLDLSGGVGLMSQTELGILHLASTDEDLDRDHAYTAFLATQTEENRAAMIAAAGNGTVAGTRTLEGGSVREITGLEGEALETATIAAYDAAAKVILQEALDDFDAAAVLLPMMPGFGGGSGHVPASDETAIGVLSGNINVGEGDVFSVKAACEAHFGDGGVGAGVALGGEIGPGGLFGLKAYVQAHYDFNHNAFVAEGRALLSVSQQDSNPLMDTIIRVSTAEGLRVAGRLDTSSLFGEDILLLVVPLEIEIRTDKTFHIGTAEGENARLEVLGHTFAELQVQLTDQKLELAGEVLGQQGRLLISKLTREEWEGWLFEVEGSIGLGNLPGDIFPESFGVSGSLHFVRLAKGNETRSEIEMLLNIFGHESTLVAEIEPASGNLHFLAQMDPIRLGLGQDPCSGIFSICLTATDGESKPRIGFTVINSELDSLDVDGQFKVGPYEMGVRALMLRAGDNNPIIGEPVTAERLVFFVAHGSVLDNFLTDGITINLELGLSMEESSSAAAESQAAITVYPSMLNDVIEFVGRSIRWFIQLKNRFLRGILAAAERLLQTVNEMLSSATERLEDIRESIQEKIEEMSAAADRRIDDWIASVEYYEGKIEGLEDRWYVPDLAISGARALLRGAQRALEAARNAKNALARAASSTTDAIVDFLQNLIEVIQNLVAPLAELVTDARETVDEWIRSAVGNVLSLESTSVIVRAAVGNDERQIFRRLAESGGFASATQSYQLGTLSLAQNSRMFVDGGRLTTASDKVFIMRHVMTAGEVNTAPGSTDDRDLPGALRHGTVVTLQTPGFKALKGVRQDTQGWNGGNVELDDEYGSAQWYTEGAYQFVTMKTTAEIASDNDIIRTGDSFYLASHATHTRTERENNFRVYLDRIDGLPSMDYFSGTDARYKARPSNGAYKQVTVVTACSGSCRINAAENWDGLVSVPTELNIKITDRERWGDDEDIGVRELSLTRLTRKVSSEAPDSNGCWEVSYNDVGIGRTWSSTSGRGRLDLKVKWCGAGGTPEETVYVGTDGTGSGSQLKLVSRAQATAFKFNVADGFELPEEPADEVSQEMIRRMTDDYVAPRDEEYGSDGLAALTGTMVVKPREALRGAKVEVFLPATLGSDVEEAFSDVLGSDRAVTRPSKVTANFCTGNEAVEAECVTVEMNSVQGDNMVATDLEFECEAPEEERDAAVELEGDEAICAAIQSIHISYEGLRVMFVSEIRVLADNVPVPYTFEIQQMRLSSTGERISQGAGSLSFDMVFYGAQETGTVRPRETAFSESFDFNLLETAQNLAGVRERLPEGEDAEDVSATDLSTILQPLSALEPVSNFVTTMFSNLLLSVFQPRSELSDRLEELSGQVADVDTEEPELLLQSIGNRAVSDESGDGNDKQKHLSVTIENKNGEKIQIDLDGTDEELNDWFGIVETKAEAKEDGFSTLRRIPVWSHLAEGEKKLPDGVEGDDVNEDQSAGDVKSNVCDETRFPGWIRPSFCNKSEWLSGLVGGTTQTLWDQKLARGLSASSKKAKIQSSKLAKKVLKESRAGIYLFDDEKASQASFVKRSGTGAGRSEPELLQEQARMVVDTGRRARGVLHMEVDELVQLSAKTRRTMAVHHGFAGETETEIEEIEEK